MRAQSQRPVLRARRPNDDVAGVLPNMGITRPSRWRLYFTLATMVAVLNGVAGGSAAAFGADLAGLPLAGAGRCCRQAGW
jgi:hypothetical protein